MYFNSCCQQLVFLLFCVILFQNVNAGPDHKKLMSDLLTNYDVMERPVQNDNDTVNVKFGVTLLNLLDVNAFLGHLEANLWLSLEWNDYQLKWDPSKYGGISSLSIFAHRIWRPDIYLYNSVHDQFDNTYQTSAVVKNDGNVTYIPPGIFRSSCVIDVTDYPFDEQNCTLKFGSWTYHSGKINISMKGKGAELSSFVPNSDWDLIGAPGKVNVVFYPCCPESYVDIAYVIHLKRKGDAIFSSASFSLWLAALTNLLSLFLPTNSKQRLTLGMGALFGLLFMLTSVNYMGGRACSLVAYFKTLTFITLITLMTNVFISYFYHNNPNVHQMNKWVHTLFCKLFPRFLFLNRLPEEISARTGSTGNTGTQHGTAEHYEELITDLQILVQKMNGKVHESVNDWQYLAIVLDRLTFLVYTISVGVFFIAFYCRF